MFTGLIEGMGIVESVDARGNGLTMTIEGGALLEGVTPGDSIAVSGVCLTAATVDGGKFTFDLLEETVDRTYFAAVGVGDALNLELPLRAGDRLGGHFVQGHVDGVGKIVAATPSGDDKVIEVALPEELLPYAVEKGSIAIDGISLTVAALRGNRIEIALIPETLARTTLGIKGEGASVHIEVDVLGKYVERFVRPMVEGRTT